MKTAFVISASPTSFSAISYQADLRESLRHIADLGYDAVEIGVRDPAQIDVDYIESSARECGLPICAIGTGQAYGEEGLSLTSTDPQVRGAALQRLKDQAVLAERLGAMVIVGLIRGGVMPSADKARALATLKDSLADYLSFASERVLTIIEPINRYETGLLNTVPESIQFVREMGCPSLKLLLDTFHMNIEEVSIQGSIAEASDLIAHVHTADSNRFAPGCGHLDFVEVVRSLRSVGYGGYLSAEVLPVPSAGAAAEMAIGHLRRCL